MRAETVEGFHTSIADIILIRFSFALTLTLPVTTTFHKMILRIKFVSMSTVIECDMLIKKIRVIGDYQ